VNELALFAGAGGGILGGRLLGWRTVCAVEWDAYAASVLVARQNDHSLEPFPVWDDVRTFDGRPWRGVVDVVSGGFPCQGYSGAARGRTVAEDLWPEMRRIVADVAPRYVFAENVVRTTHGPDIGYLHTPTCTANYASPSMQKHPCAREFVRVFGRPSPTNHEWLMGWPAGWTELKPLGTGKYLAWRRQHSTSLPAPLSEADHAKTHSAP
jgi:site-specific DNA-cytosine methylase